MKPKLFLVSLLIFCFSRLVSQENIVVFYDFDKYHLNNSATEELEKWILANPNAEVTTIYGFCDWKGTNIYNDSLSVKRVNSLYRFLKERKVSIKPNFATKGFGEDFEQSNVQSENRKVLIVYELKTDNQQPTTNNQGLSTQFKGAKAGETIRLKEIYFYNMTPRILPKSKPLLIELLCALEDNPTLKIEIQGHICCQKQYDINDLSVMRARAIYNYLISKKINRKRLSYKGFGTSKPIHPIPEQSEQEQNENRRVEILVLEH